MLNCGPRMIEIAILIELCSIIKAQHKSKLFLVSFWTVEKSEGAKVVIQ